MSLLLALQSVTINQTLTSVLGDVTVQINQANSAIAIQIDTATPGFIGRLYKAKKQETTEEKRLRRESYGIIARIETQELSPQLFDDAKDVIDQLKDEIRNLAAKERVFEAENKYSNMIRVQLAQEQLQAQIEEIDTAFVIMTIMAEID